MVYIFGQQGEADQGAEVDDNEAEVDAHEAVVDAHEAEVDADLAEANFEEGEDEWDDSESTQEAFRQAYLASQVIWLHIASNLNHFTSVISNKLT